MREDDRISGCLLPQRYPTSVARIPSAKAGRHWRTRPPTMTADEIRPRRTVLGSQDPVPPLLDLQHEVRLTEGWVGSHVRVRQPALSLVVEKVGAIHYPER